MQYIYIYIYIYINIRIIILKIIIDNYRKVIITEFNI